jgi:hypothetical protein
MHSSPPAELDLLLEAKGALGAAHVDHLAPLQGLPGGHGGYLPQKWVRPHPICRLQGWLQPISRAPSRPVPVP